MKTRMEGKEVVEVVIVRSINPIQSDQAYLYISISLTLSPPIIIS